MKRLLILMAGLAPLACAQSGFQFRYDSSQNRWALSNGVVTATLQLTESGVFQIVQAGLIAQPWQAAQAGCSPIHFSWNGNPVTKTTPFTLVNQYTATTSRNGMRQGIVLQDTQGLMQVELHFDMFPSQPVLRFRAVVTNLSPDTAYVTASDMLHLTLSDTGGPFRAFHVNQWAVLPRDLDFQSSQVTLNANGTPFSTLSGSTGTQVSWVALRDPSNRGVFGGWEFNGRSHSSVRNFGADHAIQFSAPIDGIHHPVAPGASFYTPAGFLGFFQGDWDEAGYRTQRFVEASLARAAPDLQRFPYMSWDSWGFLEQFDEEVLRRNADVAAQLGVELFIVDLGWAMQLGDWRPDPAKFPSGLRALSDYVHSLGMKFGIHFTPAEAAPDSPILNANPDWTSSESDNYFGAVSLCLSHTPVRDWMVNEIVRVIDDYGVDWILQDGQNMVKGCTKSTHTHDPADSNYANAVEGIDAVVERVLQQRPNVSWENCENGGNMMTFKMVQDYVTSITNDASGALGSRQGVYGATYPFPPRFADRYSPESPVTPYATRSYMFGGPWHLMNQLDSMTQEQIDFAAAEIAAYKQMRGHIRDGKVYHLSAPGVGRIDAIESSHLANVAVVIVTREGGDADTFKVVFRGLSGAGTYKVHFQTDPRTLLMTGQQLATTGVMVSLPNVQDAEIVYAERQ